MEAFEQKSAQEIVLEAAKEGKTGHDVADRIERRAGIVGAQTSEGVRKTANEIREIVGGRTVTTFEGDQAGEAQQGEEGSAKISVASTVKSDGSINTVQLRDIVAHEGEHEKQADQWNAEEVRMGDGEKVTREDVSEVGAMSVQQTLEHVSGGYRETFKRITRTISPEQARDVARSGDLLSLAA